MFGAFSQLGTATDFKLGHYRPLMLQRSRQEIPIFFVTGFPDLPENYELLGKVFSKPIALDKLTDEIQALFSAAPEK